MDSSRVLSSSYMARVHVADDRDRELIVPIRWRIVSFLGKGLPAINPVLLQHIRRHLREHYCAWCGEYIYNPYPNRRVKHYHNVIRPRYKSLFYERMLLLPRLYMMEWERKFPRVLKLMLTEEEIRAGVIKQQAPRLAAFRLWSFDEWNMFYPDVYVSKELGMTRLTEQVHPLPDVLFTPDINFN